MEGIEIKGFLYLVITGIYIATLIGVAIYTNVQDWKEQKEKERKRQEYLRENEK